MSLDSIRTGLKVVTRTRIGRAGGARGGVEGVISAITRHPVTRKIVSVVIDPGTGNEDDQVVADPRWLKLAA